MGRISGSVVPVTATRNRLRLCARHRKSQTHSGQTTTSVTRTSSGTAFASIVRLRRSGGSLPPRRVGGPRPHSGKGRARNHHRDPRRGSRRCLRFARWGGSNRGSDRWSARRNGHPYLASGGLSSGVRPVVREFRPRSRKAGVACSRLARLLQQLLQGGEESGHHVFGGGPKHSRRPAGGRPCRAGNHGG